jgi:hypothetical protein
VTTRRQLGITSTSFIDNLSSADGSSDNQTLQPMGVQRIKLNRQYTVKKVIDFPSSAGMSLTILLPARESLVIASRLGRGKSLTLFYSVGVQTIKISFQRIKLV